jgi:hypothetical protein
VKTQLQLINIIIIIKACSKFAQIIPFLKTNPYELTSWLKAVATQEFCSRGGRENRDLGAVAP